MFSTVKDVSKNHKNTLDEKFVNLFKESLWHKTSNWNLVVALPSLEIRDFDEFVLSSF